MHEPERLRPLPEVRVRHRLVSDDVVGGEPRSSGPLNCSFCQVAPGTQEERLFAFIFGILLDMNLLTYNVRENLGFFINEGLPKANR